MTLTGDVVNDARTSIVADKRRPNDGGPDLVRNARAVDLFTGMRRPTIPSAVDERERAQQFHLAVGAAVNEPPGVDIPLEVRRAVSHEVSTFVDENVPVPERERDPLFHGFVQPLV